MHEYLIDCIKNIFGDSLCPRGVRRRIVRIVGVRVRKAWARGGQVKRAWEVDVMVKMAWAHAIRNSWLPRAWMRGLEGAWAISCPILSFTQPVPHSHAGHPYAAAAVGTWPAGDCVL